MGGDSSRMALEASLRSAVNDNALNTPLTAKLTGKRVVLASSSPRRKEILANILGLTPEIVPSTFDELLAHSDYAADLSQYAAGTASEKGLEVYRRLVDADPEDPPDLVISSDTVIIHQDQIMEKPMTRKENLRMLEDLNGRTHDVWTAVTVIAPQVAIPGYSVRSLLERTSVEFAENDHDLLQAYVDSEEGIDRAGGYAIQGRGGLLVKRIDGDYNTVVGFPAYAFHKWLTDLMLNEEMLADI